MSGQDVKRSESADEQPLEFAVEELKPV